MGRPAETRASQDRVRNGSAASALTPPSRPVSRAQGGVDMADDNEELQADEEVPAPAEDGFEQLEIDSPAERSGHVAVTDGQCMYVWGGYKVRLSGLLFLYCHLRDVPV